MRLQLRGCLHWLGIVVVTVAFAVPALADSIVYTNFTSADPGGFSGSSVFITSNQVADSFILSSATTLTSVTFDTHFEAATSVGWAILGSDPFPAANSPLATLTTASVSGTFLGSFDGGLITVYSDTFSLPSVALGPGTYYLVLGNDVAGGFEGEWEMSNGPSAASGNLVGSLANLPGFGCTTCSEAFAISGTSATQTPEPSSLLLLGTGLLGLMGMGLYKKRLA